MINKVHIWAQAVRPKTLTASMGPVILGLALAFHLSNKGLNFYIAFSTLLCAILLQIGTNLVNDYFDFKKGTDTQQRLGPVRVTQSGLLSEIEVKWGYRICFFIALIIGTFLMVHGGLPIIVIGILSIVFAYAYTGGPFPLSYFAMGELLALIFFGPIAVWGTLFLQTKENFNIAWMVGLGVGFVAATLMAINNLRDNKEDKKNKKYTLAVLFGEKFGRTLCLLLIILSITLPFITYLLLKLPWVLLASFSPYPFYKSFKYISQGEIDQKLNRVLAHVGQYLFLYSALFSIGLIIG